MVSSIHEGGRMGGSMQLMMGVLFGSIGLGFFVYGKKQKAVVPLLSGIGLLVMPYFISSMLLLLLICVLLIVLPFIVKI